MQEAETKFRRFLAEQKLRYTAERRQIFHEIIRAREHFDADTLLLRLKSKNLPVSRATVYRTLDLLVKLGLLRRTCVGDRSAVYESVVGWARHGHLVCQNCGRVDEFRVPEIDEALDRVCEEAGFDLRNRCLQLFGYCADCRDRIAEKGESESDPLQVVTY
jgi:Fur family ferric uptake transcriptional regulator